MRRSICVTEPIQALAGERKTWKFTFSPTITLPKGTVFKLDIQSKGRPLDWEAPSCSLKEGKNVIWADIGGGKTIQGKPVEVPNSQVPQYEFVLPQDVASGKKITILMGSPVKGKDETKGNLAQLTVHRRRPFYLYIDPTGKRKYSEPDVFTLDVKGNVLSTIRILTPSLVQKNRRFDIVLRFEDEFGNLTNNAPENTLIELTHENLRDNLSWKLFLPETGFLALPNLYFNDIGVYTIRLKNMKTKEEFFSPPIKCIAQETKNIFWGLPHGESDRFDSTENIESCLRHFRDEKSFNFVATSSPESLEETSNDTWKKISQNVSELNEDERFSAILGELWAGEPKTEGLRVLLFSKDDKQILRKKEARSSSLKKIYKLFSPKELISIPSFTMGKISLFNFQDFNPDFERVAEIYNAWGSSECSQSSGNKFPIRSAKEKKEKESNEGSLLEALKDGCRFGFVSGGLDDRSIFSSFYDTDQQQYAPGLTAVLADQLTRPNIFEAIYERRCYATTGERIILGFSLAGKLMGSELSSLEKPGLHVNRHFEGYAAGTKPLEKIELLRNGEVIQTFTPKTNSFEFEYDDLEPLSKTILKSPKCKNPFVFYYLRITQKGGHMAWSSPIWIDFYPLVKGAKRTNVKK